MTLNKFTIVTDEDGIALCNFLGVDPFAAPFGVVLYCGEDMPFPKTGKELHGVTWADQYLITSRNQVITALKNHRTICSKLDHKFLEFPTWPLQWHSYNAAVQLFEL